MIYLNLENSKKFIFSLNFNEKQYFFYNTIDLILRKYINFFGNLV